MEITKSKGRRPVWMTPFGQEPWGDYQMDRPWFSWPRMIGEEYNPSLDLYEKDGNYILSAELPGVNREDISVTIQNNVITITGKKSASREEEGADYFIRESVSGSFSRSFRLPEEIVAEQVEATFKDGILKLVMPHREETRSRKIEIKS